MKKRQLSTITAILLLSGCASYSYKQLPVTTEGRTFEDLRTTQEFEFPSDMSELTLSDAQRIALLNNPDFLSIQFSIDSARAKYYQSYSSYAPTLNAGMTVSQSFSKIYATKNGSKTRTQTENYTPSLSGQLLIFDCLGREMTILASKYELQQSEHLLLDAQRLLMQAVAYAYNDVVLNEAQRDIVLAEIEYSQNMLEESEKKLKAGSTLRSDVLNFKISLENSRLSLIQAEYAIKSSKYVLASYLGIVDGTIPGEIILPPATIPYDEVLPSVEVYLDIALINRPDLKAYRDSLKIAEYNYWNAWSSLGPSFSAFYELSSNSNHNVTSGSSSNTSSTANFGYGLNAEWNLFNGFYDFQAIKAAKANIAEVDYLLAQELINIVTEVRTAYDNYVSSVEEAKLSYDIRTLTQETRDLVDKEYKEGTALVTRVNEAEASLVAAKNNFVTSVINISNAKAQLEAAVFAVQNPLEEDEEVR